MSVYSFNSYANNDHHVNGGANSTNSINGNQIKRYQDDCISRNFSSANSNNHHLDMSSVQLTRPTSKTAMLVRQRRAMLEQLSCSMCKGYLIDATTVDECMDSFCKSCIVTHLSTRNDCPKCGILIHKTNPLGAIKLDKTLQDIVYKLVPGLYDKEMKRRRDFYKELYGISSSDDDDEDSTSLSQNSLPVGEKYGNIAHPKPYYKPTDSIDLSIEPQTRNDCSTIYYDNRRKSIVTRFTGDVHNINEKTNSFFAIDSQQFKTYLRCPAKLTASQMKKFIAAKFNICRNDTIHLLYLNESLKDNYSLIDIAYIYDWRGIEHMRLFYIIERDLSKPDDLILSQQHSSSNGQSSKIFHSVSTSPISSSQVVKKVCIDPHPTFYEESNHEDNTTYEVNGRVMRPRVVYTATKPIRSISTTQSATQPILRTSGSSRESSSISDTRAKQGSSSNGLAAATSNQKSATGFTSRHQQAPQSRFLNTDPKNGVSNQKRLESPPISTKKLLEDIGVGSIPKISINLRALDQAQKQNGERSANTYGRVVKSNDTGSTNIIAKQTNNRQLIVPVVSKANYYAATSSGASQSSLVTLAGFTQTRNNHVVAMSSTSTATISNSYRNILNTKPASKTDTDKSSLRSNNNYVVNKQNSMGTQQLAYSIVTETGIAIVNGMNNDQSRQRSQNGPGSINSPIKNGLLALPASSSQSSSVSKTNNSTHCTTSSSGANNTVSTYSNNNQHQPSTDIAANLSSSSSSSSSSTTSSSNINNNGTSASRHHIKVKPVYKTVADPTKLIFQKINKIDKLNYTARH